MRLLGFQGTHSSTCSAWMSFLHIQTFSCVCTSVTILFSCWVKWWTLDLYYNFSSQAQVTATCLSWLACMSLMRYLPCDLWVQIFILQLPVLSWQSCMFWFFVSKVEIMAIVSHLESSICWPKVTMHHWNIWNIWLQIFKVPGIFESSFSLPFLPPCKPL